MCPRLGSKLRVRVHLEMLGSWVESKFPLRSLSLIVVHETSGFSLLALRLLLLLHLLLLLLFLLLRLESLLRLLCLLCLLCLLRLGEGHLHVDLNLFLHLRLVL